MVSVYFLTMFASIGFSLAIKDTLKLRFRNAFINKLSTCERCQSFWLTIIFSLLSSTPILTSVMLGFVSYLISSYVIDFFTTIKIKFK